MVWSEHCDVYHTMIKILLLCSPVSQAPQNLQNLGQPDQPVLWMPTQSSQVHTLA